MDNEMKTSAEGIQTGTEDAQQGKTFTQDDVNRIVQDRLSKERAKTESGYIEKEKELARREFLLDARKELSDRGYPDSIMEALNAADKDTFKKSLDILDAYMKERGATKVDSKLEQKKARFTAPSHLQNSGFDPVRQAMGLH